MVFTNIKGNLEIKKTFLGSCVLILYEIFYFNISLIYYISKWAIRILYEEMLIHEMVSSFNNL